MAWLKLTEAATKLPRLILQGRLSYDFDGIPLIAERLSFRKRMNLLKVGIDHMFKSNLSHGLPPIVQVEPTNICNLECPLCPTGSGLLDRKKGFMSLETFHRILDELGDILVAVNIFCFGEPFMNKDLPKMIEACTNRNILTLTATNGHFVQTSDEALKIVDAGLSMMVVAIDGSTQEIYQSYRKGGSLEKAKRFITLIEEAKSQRRSRFPYTAIRCVVTRDNQGDLPNMEKLAMKLGVNMFTYKTLGCMTHSGEYKEYEPSNNDVRRFEYAGSSRISKGLIQCPFPFRQPIIFWDGTVVGCEYDHDMQMAFGNVKENRFIDVWNSPKALQLRHSIRKGYERPDFCLRCPYQDRIQKGCNIFCKELRRA